MAIVSEKDTLYGLSNEPEDSDPRFLELLRGKCLGYISEKNHICGKCGVRKSCAKERINVLVALASVAAEQALISEAEEEGENDDWF